MESVLGKEKIDSVVCWTNSKDECQLSAHNERYAAHCPATHWTLPLCWAHCLCHFSVSSPPNLLFFLTLFFPLPFMFFALIPLFIIPFTFLLPLSLCFKVVLCDCSATGELLLPLAHHTHSHTQLMLLLSHSGDRVWRETSFPGKWPSHCSLLTTPLVSFSSLFLSDAIQCQGPSAGSSWCIDLMVYRCCLIALHCITSHC